LRYYLSGAISSLIEKGKDFRAYFKEYENELIHHLTTPQDDFIFNPADTDWPEDVKWERCMKFDIKYLMDTDCLVLLPNWKKSKGAKLEVYLCKKLKIRIVKLNDLIRELMINAS